MENVKGFEISDTRYILLYAMTVPNLSWTFSWNFKAVQSTCILLKYWYTANLLWQHIVWCVCVGEGGASNQKKNPKWGEYGSFLEQHNKPLMQLCCPLPAHSVDWKLWGNHCLLFSVIYPRAVTQTRFLCVHFVAIKNHSSFTLIFSVILQFVENNVGHKFNTWNIVFTLNFSQR